ncbi:MAG: tagatose 1,6-diphosphate aldolase [Chloroflexota bacterium]
MTVELTPGRWRGLKTTSLADDNIFSILAFDQRGSYRRMLPDGTPYADAVKMKEEIVGTLTRYASAVLLDPTYGLGPAMQMTGKSGLVMALEKSGYSGDDTARKPQFVDTWTPEKIRTMGGSAVKLLVYYHPDTGHLAEELEDLIREKTAEIHAVDLPVFLEPMSYSIDADVSKDSAEFAATKRHVVVETARRLGKTGVDVLKMEFPLDYKYADRGEWREACDELSEASDVPWVLLSAGVDFETFEEQTVVACEAGASGFLAGRAIWKEAVNMMPEARTAFLDGTASERIQRLIEISGEKARPWSEFYTVPGSSEDWYDSYGE